MVVLTEWAEELSKKRQINPNHEDERPSHKVGVFLGTEHIKTAETFPLLRFNLLEFLLVLLVLYRCKY